MSAKGVAMLGCVVGLACMGIGEAHATDPFHTRADVPVSAGSRLLGDHIGCTYGAPASPLTLQDAIERALCANPDTREAWTIIEARAAALGVSKAAYLPTLSASGQWVHDDTVTDVRDHPALSTNYSTPEHSGTLSLGWVLFDFGGRRAALNQARALMIAAQDNADAVLQKTFADAAKAYYATQAAGEQMRADDALVADALNTLTAAKARVGHGVAPVTEMYQAQTAYEQARVTQTRDLGDARAAQGSLASVMALSPDTPLTLAPLDHTAQPGKMFQHSVSALMAQASASNPAIATAEQQLQAAKAEVTQARAQGRPTIKLVAQYSQNNQPVQLGLGLPHYPSTGHDGYIGIQLNVPLFSGFATTYQVHEAEARVDQQTVLLDKARQQVALQVWTSYQTLQTDTENLTTSTQLQNVATLAWESAQRRYRAGVATILELLSTQKALAESRQQRIEVLLAWRYDRLALASALGKLRWSDIHDH